MENAELFSPENNSGAGDSFSVEELLNFTDTDDSLAGATDSAVESSNLSFSGGDFCYRSFAEPQFSDDLCVPCEEIAELEWLSNFVEDSFSSADLQNLNLISGIKPLPEARSEPDQYTTQPQPDLSVATPCDLAARLSILSPPTPPPPSGDHPLMHYASDKTPQCMTGPMGPKTPSVSHPLHCMSNETQQYRTGPMGPNTSIHCMSDKTSQWRTEPMGPNTPSGDHPLHCESDKAQQWGTGPMGPKKSSSDHPSPQKRKREVVAGADGRRCLHCETDKTPQWRTGPMGPKTLCNACGVRYKSGRLVPEYRPMASPTFVTAKHSNSHRKVMELRRQKDAHCQFFDMGGTVVFDGSDGDDYLIHQHIGPDFRNLI